MGFVAVSAESDSAIALDPFHSLIDVFPSEYSNSVKLNSLRESESCLIKSLSIFIFLKYFQLRL